MPDILYDLLSLRQLRESVKECRAYDGWSAEYMLETFIKDNGFNPFEELENQKSLLLNLYCDNDMLREIKYYQTSKDLDIKRLEYLDKIIKERVVDRIHQVLIYELFKTIEV